MESLHRDTASDRERRAASPLTSRNPSRQSEEVAFDLVTKLRLGHALSTKLRFVLLSSTHSTS